MGQLLRQIGVVIGLTVILTFPVTVVSGAGSQKQADHDHTNRVAVTGGKGHVRSAEDLSRNVQVSSAMRTYRLDER
jgi:hypothetical protein